MYISLLQLPVVSLLLLLFFFSSELEDVSLCEGPQLSSGYQVFTVHLFQCEKLCYHFFYGCLY